MIVQVLSVPNRWKELREKDYLAVYQRKSHSFIHEIYRVFIDYLVVLLMQMRMSLFFIHNPYMYFD